MASLTLISLSLMLTYLTLVESQRYDDLFSKLTSQYESRDSKYTIPVTSERDVVHVNVSMTFIQIQSLDVKTGDAVLEAWMIYNWRDARLRWKPAKHGGIEKLHVPPSFIWKPDIVLFNGQVRSEEYNAVVEHDGSVLFVPKTIITTRCNTTSYTDGTVKCAMKFGSWTYSGVLMSPRSTGDSSILSSYVPGSFPGWDVVSAHAKRHVTHYPCCPEPYPDVTFTLVFKQAVSSWFDYY